MLDFIEIVWVYIWVIYAHLNPYVGVYTGSFHFVQSPIVKERLRKLCGERCTFESGGNLTAP